MKIEKINENKIKIIFNYKELEENNISIHSFLANSLESQKLFLAILDIANEDLGFDISNSKISYEAFSFDNKTFIIFVTKNNTLSIADLENLDTENHKNIFPDIRDTNHSNVILNKKDSTNFENLDILLYGFDSINEVFSFCDFINANLLISDLENSLYQYDNLFFIKINLKNLTVDKKKLLLYNVSEFKNCLKLSNLTLIKLEEFSNLLIKNNAIQVL